MRKGNWIAAGLIAASAAGAGITLSGPVLAAGGMVEGPKVEWKFSASGNRRAWTEGMETMAALLKERTGGSFNIEIVYGEALGPIRKTLDNMLIGGYEGGMYCVAFDPGKTPALTALDLPFLPLADIKVQAAVHDAFIRHPAVKAELDKWNAIPLMSGLVAQYEFIGKGEPPMALADWQGMQVRAIGGLADAMTAIGAVPVAVPTPETYSAIERGTVQAAALAAPYVFTDFRLQEITSWYTTNLSVGTLYCPMIVSKSAYEALPSQYRELIEEVRPMAYDGLIEAYAVASEKSRKLLGEANLKPITYSDADVAAFRAKAGKPVWDKWVEEKSAAGLPARELVDLIMTTAQGAR